MDLAEAFIKAKKNLIIYISGMTCSGKTKLAKALAKIIKADHYQQKSYYNLEKANKKILPNNVTVVNWDSDNAVDWDKMKKDIEEHTGKLIVSGNAMVNDKLPKPDFHIHITISKQKCLENRIEYIKENKDRFPKEFDQLDSGTEKLKMNILTLPYYFSLKERMTVTKWLNAMKMDEDKLIDESLSYLFAMMKQQLDKLVKDGNVSADLFTTEQNKEKNTPVSSVTESDDQDTNKDTQNEVEDEKSISSDQDDFEYIDNEGTYDINKHFEKEEDEISPENIYKQHGMTINPVQYGMQGWQGYQYY